METRMLQVEGERQMFPACLLLHVFWQFFTKKSELNLATALYLTAPVLFLGVCHYLLTYGAWLQAATIPLTSL